MFRFFALIVLYTSCVFAFSLEDLRSSIKTNDVLGSFTQKKHLQNFSTPIISSGVFHIDKKTLFWIVKDPIFSVIKINTQGIWQCQNCGGVNSVEMASIFKEIKNKNFELVPTQYDKSLFLQIMELDFRELEKYFTLKLEGSKEKWHLLLKPKGILEQIFTQIDIMGGIEGIREVKLIETNGDVTQTLFSVL